MVKPAAPVHDGRQARAVAVRNGAGSLPGRQPFPPFFLCKMSRSGRLGAFHGGMIPCFDGNASKKHIFSRRGAEGAEKEHSSFFYSGKFNQGDGRKKAHPPSLKLWRTRRAHKRGYLSPQGEDLGMTKRLVNGFARGNVVTHGFFAGQ